MHMLRAESGLPVQTLGLRDSVDSLRHDILLQTESTVLRRAVADSLSSIGVMPHADDRSAIKLKIVHIAKYDDLGSVHSATDDGRPVVVLIEPDVKPFAAELLESAISVIDLPFLSNELRMNVGRILRLRIADSEIYERADRPVPTVVKQTSIMETDLEATVPPRSPTLPTKRTLRTDELPPIDTFADMPKVSTNESLPPLPVTEPQSSDAADTIQQTTINTISAEYIEKVVWEVVPKLAERILREEIARLLKDTSSRS